MEKPITDDYGNSVDRRTAHGKMSYDPRISLNTILICVTLIGGLLTLTDRMSSYASTSAVQQNKQLVLEQQLKMLVEQQRLDRQEILTELKELRKDLKELVTRK